MVPVPNEATMTVPASYLLQLLNTTNNNPGYHKCIEKLAAAQFEWWEYCIIPVISIILSISLVSNIMLREGKSSLKNKYKLLEESIEGDNCLRQEPWLGYA
jgi:hypothetical protein